MRNRKDDSLVPPDIYVVAFAWNNNDMKPTMNLVGQDYVPFCAANSVGINDKTLRLNPVTELMGLKDLSVKMIMDGQSRDDDSNVFMDWRQLLHRSDYHTCLEVEICRASFPILVT